MQSNADQEIMPELVKENKKDESTILLGYLAIFVVAFFIRLYGAIHINLIGSEAAYILETDKTIPFTPSIFQNLANVISLELPEYSTLTFRLLGVIAGTCIVFLPFLVRKKFGTLEALLFSLFIAIDPFMIANSILATGNTFVILTAGLLVISWINDRYEFIPILLVSMGLMGRGFTYFVFISTLTIIFTSNIRLVLNGFKSGISTLKTMIEDHKNMFFVPLIVLIIFLFTSTNLNIFISDFAIFYRGLFAGYQPGNSILLYPVAILVYIPLSILLVFTLFFIKTGNRKELIHLIFYWTCISLVLVSIYPGHRVIDLVWVSIPLWLLGSLVLASLSKRLRSIIRSNLGFFIVLAVAIGNFILSLLSFTYKTHFNLPIVDNLVAIFTIIVFTIALIIYWAYLQNLQTAIKGSILTIVGFLLLFQISNAIHTAGLSGNPEKEIFWGGYYPDKALIKGIVDTSIGNQLGTLAKIDVWADREVNPQVYWDYGSNHIKKQISVEQPEMDYLAVFKADEEPVKSEAVYLGQKFIAESYPIWTTSPISALIQDDFWSWFFMRDSQQVQAYNYLWLRADQFP